MPQIFVLPEHIASQIAAGEVVERPASVVKELVENSIDAGATKIVVDVSEGCRTIRVADNGCGMAPDDASLAFQRHATSKLKNADDLWNLRTLGFRGEALPSIAAVSKLICSTRTANKEIGTKVISHDGNMAVSETGCAQGTIIEVEDLFYNVPARLKFLKKPATEFANIFEIVQSLAIAYPDIAFELSLDGTQRLRTHGSGSLDQALAESNFLSIQASNKANILTLAAKDGVLSLEIEGRLVSPTNFRGDRKGILTIVNKRPVRCPLTYKALDYAYADLIPKGRYPLAVVHLKANSADLDINIHPTKKEIRYSRGNEVYLFMQRQIMHALRNAEKSTSHPFKAGPSYKTAFYPEELNFQPLPESNRNRQAPLNATVFNRAEYQIEKGQQLSLQEAAEDIYLPSSLIAQDNELVREIIMSSQLAALPSPKSAPVPAVQPVTLPLDLPSDWRLAGYVNNTYILLETKTGFSMVEQHIAHERVLYEKLLSTDIQAEGQTLIISLPLQLTAEQKIVLEENRQVLAEQGFEFEFGNSEVNCSQVPVELAHKDYASIIQAMLQELVESSQANPRLEIVKSLACQSAVKNGMPLVNEQIIELLSLWHKTPRNETCPHGRPIELKFSYEKLFQMFHPA